MLPIKVRTKVKEPGNREPWIPPGIHRDWLSYDFSLLPGITNKLHEMLRIDGHVVHQIISYRKLGKLDEEGDQCITRARNGGQARAIPVIGTPHCNIA